MMIVMIRSVAVVALVTSKTFPTSILISQHYGIYGRIKRNLFL